MLKRIVLCREGEHGVSSINAVMVMLKLRWRWGCVSWRRWSVRVVKAKAQERKDDKLQAKPPGIRVFCRPRPVIYCSCCNRHRISCSGCQHALRCFIAFPGVARRFLDSNSATLCLARLVSAATDEHLLQNLGKKRRQARSK